MTTLMYVAMNGDHPTDTALTLEAAQAQANRAAKQFGSASRYEYRWDEHGAGQWRLMSRSRERDGRFSWTSRSVHEVAFTPDEKTTVDGPFPIRVSATPSGAALDVSAFLFKAVFAEQISKADEDPEGFTQHFAEMADLLREANHGGRDGHARHAFDEAMRLMLKEYAADGELEVYGEQVSRLAKRLTEIAAPRPIPAQREAGAE